MTRKLIIIFPLVLLLLVAINYQTWSAKLSLYQSGFKDFTPDQLMHAIKARSSKVAINFIHAGSADQLSSTQASRALLSALRDEKLDVADALLPECDVLSEEDRHAVLRTAIKLESFPGTKWLVSNGFTTEILMDDGQSPVDWSISRNDAALTKHLLTLGFPYTAQPGERSSLEHALSTNASPPIITALLDHGADPNAFTSDNSPLLHRAITTSSPEVVTAMFGSATKTQVDIKDALGKTALHQAIQSGNVDSASALVEAGADLKYVSAEGNNYLHYAAMTCQSPEVISLLLSQGLDLNSKTSQGFNPLEVAAVHANAVASRTLLANTATLSENFILQRYAASDQQSLSTLFLTGQSSPDGTVANGDTFLIDCVKNKRYDMMRFLIREGASLNLEGPELEPPLAFAVAVQDIEATRILLSAGAEVNFEFKKPVSESFKETIITDGAIKFFLEKDSRITPIMMACDQANMPLCVLLKSYGAKETATKKYRFSAGGLAARRKKTDIVQLMLGAVPGNRDRTVTVDLSSQRATVYGKDKKTVMSFRISSGKKGKATKTGTFVVTNKKRHHVSTIYDSDMPYFQRLSYSDFGFHTGVVPGYPASSGCIRCPDSYARKLYYYLKLGDVVTIQR